MTFCSSAANSPNAETTPSKYLLFNTKARFTKFPSTSANSLFTRDWKSNQVNSLSLLSGAMEVKVYFNSSTLSGCLSKYSCNQTAQFLEVENLSPSKFKNSDAGTLSGKINSPCSFNRIGKITA